MATSVRKFDRASIAAQVFDIARQLLTELGSQHGVKAVRGSAHLDRDLGLGSLERVELFVRLDRAFGSHLPERVVAEASTLDDVIAAVSTTIGADNEAVDDDRRRSLRNATRDTVPGAKGETTAPSGNQGSVQAGGHTSGKAPAPAPAWAETWQEVIRYRAAEDGGRAHLMLWDDDGEAQRISFGELHAGARRAAAEMARRGISRGDAVALMLPTGREFFITFAGVLLAGGVPVPIYPPVRADRIAEYAERQSAILRNAEARLLVTFDEAARVAKLLQPSVKSLRGTVTAATLLGPTASVSGTTGEATTSAPADTVRASSSDLALLQYTSGSTGDPKGVMLTHANLMANIRAIGEAVGIVPDDVGVSWLPLYHDMGLIGAWLLPLYFGLPVAVLSPISFLARPERWLWAVHKHGGTLTAAPNFAYELAVRKVADGDIEGLDLSTLRAALNGAEPVNAETLGRFGERFGRYGLRREALRPVYGLAEASLAVTIPRPGRGPRVDRIERKKLATEGRAVQAASAAGEAGSENAGSLDQSLRPGVLSVVSVGHPVPGHEVRIVNEQGQEVPERVEGAIWFRGPSTTSGYFHNPAATGALFPAGRESGWLNSGDRGYRAEGEIFITGRVKDIILKAGRNLYPHEIEEIAGGVPGVRKGCVVAFGAADAAAGTERLVVVAETRERHSAARQRIAAAITQNVAQAIGLPPDAVELLAPHSIPKTSSGKLRRSQARELYLAGALGAAAQPAWMQVARLTVASGARSAGQWLGRVAESLYGIYAVAVFVLWLIPAWFVVSLLPTRRAAARFTSVAVRICLAFAGVPVRVVGREHRRAAGPRVIVSNHTSYFDVLPLMGALGVDYHFVAKGEVQDMPFIGTFLRKLGHFAFDRSNPEARLRQASEIEQALRKGESVFVFPEGTFTSQPGVRPFQLGAFKSAVSVGCPILPVALTGTRRFLPDGSYLPHPARITITICAPLEPIKPNGLHSPTGPSDDSRSEELEWREIVRLRDAAREQIGRISGEPLL